MLSLDSIRVIDIETTNTCNASCPFCVRGSHMDTKDHLVWSNIVSQIPVKVWQNLKELNFNGTTGDNVMHPELLDILSWCIQNSSGRISLHTNGSIRTNEWWSKLGRLFAQSPHQVVFGLDGLADTHAIHRIGTDFDKIISNATAYIQSGGRAIWQFIPFEHNQHQIESCRQLSQQLGFEEFFVLLQDRFDASGQKDNLKRVHLSDITVSTKSLTSSGDMAASVRQSSQIIDCASQRRGWISIYADSTVWPCCYLMGWHQARSQKMNYEAINYHFRRVLELDLEDISLYKHDLAYILDTPLYQQRFPDSFKCQPNPICIQKCSV